jgi:hypothetical protein
MIKIENGGVYTAAKVARNEDAPWELIIVKDENPKVRKEIKVWASQLTALATEGMFRVDKILSVKTAARKYNEKWIDEIHVEADITPIMQYAQNPSNNAGFKPLIDDEPLPF